MPLFTGAPHLHLGCLAVLTQTVAILFELMDR